MHTLPAAPAPSIAPAAPAIKLKGTIAIALKTTAQQSHNLLDWCFAVPVIRYDTRCRFNVPLKANMSQLNLPHGNDT